MTKTLSQLRKEANAAPKFVIEVVDSFFLNSKGDNVTQDIEKALQYSVGFDNEEMKIQYWSTALNQQVKAKLI